MFIVASRWRLVPSNKKNHFQLHDTNVYPTKSMVFICGDVWVYKNVGYIVVFC